MCCPGVVLLHVFKEKRLLKLLRAVHLTFPHFPFLSAEGWICGSRFPEGNPASNPIIPASWTRAICTEILTRNHRTWLANHPTALWSPLMKTPLMRWIFVTLLLLNTYNKIMSNYPDGPFTTTPLPLRL